MASNLYGGYSSLSELKKANQARYNAATKNSQSINDYVSSGGKSTNSGSSNKTGITTMRGTGSGSSSSSTLKNNITNSISNPTSGAYSSLANNSLMKDMETAYKTSTGGSSKGTSTNSKPIVEETIEEEVYNPYEEYYNEAQKRIEEMEAQIREQNRLAVEQGTNRLEAQKSNINQAADENARQAYVQYMQSQKALPQQLASQGVSGGATETANLGLQTAYQNNVNTINQNKANRIQEIDNAIVDLKNTGDLAMVEQVLANNQAALDAYTAAYDKGVSYNQWAQQFNANREDTLSDQAYRDKVYADQMAQQEKENQWYEQSYKDQIEQQERENQWYIDTYNDTKKKEETNRVIALLENGIYNPSTASALLGVPADQLQEFVDYIKKARNLELSNTQSLISNRNTQTAKTKKENEQENKANQYYNLANSINNLYANNSVGKKAGENVIVDDGNGGYQINPDISRGSYLDLVIARTLDSNMSDEEANQFLLDLKIKPEDISRVAAYYLK